MNELLLAFPEIYEIWQNASWPVKLAMLGSGWVTGSSFLATFIPSHLTPANRNRINTALKMARKVVNASALNVGQVKRKLDDREE